MIPSLIGIFNNPDLISFFIFYPGNNQDNNLRCKMKKIEKIKNNEDRPSYFHLYMVPQRGMRVYPGNAVSRESKRVVELWNCGIGKA